jgi:hypothetical protein
MKLVKIEDVRVGQIYKNVRGGICIVLQCRTDWDYVFQWFPKNMPPISVDISLNDMRKFELIGFLNITHRIEDDKLVEIPREEFEVDDVLEGNNNGGFAIILDKKIVYNLSYKHIFLSGTRIILREGQENYMRTNYKKIGTLGVNYEFINEKLLANSEVK